MPITNENGGIDAIHTGRSLRAVTPHASDLLPDGPCRALHVNDVGNVTVSIIAVGDTSAVTWTVTGPGDINVACKAVRTGGSATSIVAVY